MKLLRLSIIAFIALVATANLAFAQTASTSSTSTSQEETTTKTISVKVKGVGCSTDIKTISANVQKLNGVSSCKTLKKGATTTFEVKMNPSLITEKEIHAAIENTAGCKNPNDRPYRVKL